MTVTPTHLAPSTVIEAGLTIINDNFDNLASQGNSLDAQQAAHAAAGHPTLYYTKAEIEAHKVSGDHDARYVAIADLTTIVRTLYDQTIAGIKTFTSNLLIKKADPELQLQHSDATIIGKLAATIASAKNIVRLYLNIASVQTVVMEAKEDLGYINFPAHDVYAKTKKLATVEYVDERAAHGLGYVLTFADWFSSYASEYNYFTNNARIQYHSVHSEAILKKIIIGIAGAADGSGTWSQIEEDVSFRISPGDYVIEAALRIYSAGSGIYNCDFELYSKNNEGTGERMYLVRIASGVAAIAYNLVVSAVFV